MKLIDAMNEQERTGEPQPIRAGRCEAWVSSRYGPARYERVLCGKAGRWYVDRQIRCGEHKEK
jgi:hypothetical protein